MTALSRDPLLGDLLALAAQAGALIMDHYAAGLRGRTKADDSPVTDADEDAERLILAGLERLAPGIPVVSEEAAAAGRWPKIADRFFLVDPLDGTREFVQRNLDFTVNIALVRNGEPVAGMVYAPASGKLYLGANGRAEAAEVDAEGRIVSRRPIHAREGHDPLTVVASRSHMDDETLAYMRRFEAAEIVSVGSSVKFCILAAGEADLYPRFGRTMEWDTAAGDAVLRAAGGRTVTQDGRPLRYGKAENGFANPPFIASGRVAGSPRA